MLTLSDKYAIHRSVWRNEPAYFCKVRHCWVEGKYKYLIIAHSQTVQCTGGCGGNPGMPYNREFEGKLYDYPKIGEWFISNCVILWT